MVLHKGCEHNQNSYGLDIMMIAAAILLFFVIREFIGWLFKTNHVQSQLSEQRSILENIQSALARNGLM